MKYRWEQGDVVIDEASGETFVLLRVYPGVFYDKDDDDLFNAGMGHLAGVHTTAVDIVSTMNGSRRKWKLGDAQKKYKNIS